MKRSRTLTPLILLLFLSLTGYGCGGGDETEVDVEAPATEAPTGTTGTETTAVAQLQPVDDSGVNGTVAFTSVDGAVRVVGQVMGLAPGQHGFHIHENGDCGPADTDNDGTPEPAGAAGGHFAPEGSPHGAPDDPAGQRHMGDLGNLEVGADSMATYERVDSLLNIDAIAGKAVIVHANADDLESQPSGNAGGRVACGIIEMENGAGMTAPMDTAATL